MKEPDTNTTLHCHEGWGPILLDMLVHVRDGVGDTRNALTNHHSVTVERVDIVIGLAISILSILTVKIAVVQILKHYEDVKRERKARAADAYASTC